MTPTKTTALLLRIAQKFVARPDAMRLEETAGEGGVSHWVMFTLNPDDEPKLIGADGTHVDALRFIATQLGRADGQRITFHLDANSAKIAREKAAGVITISFDPHDARDLLVEILTQLDIGAFMVRIDSEPGGQAMLSYCFAIVLPNPTDQAAFTAQRRFKHRRGDTMSIAGALTMLFRAMGKVAGVRFRINVEEPR